MSYRTFTRVLGDTHLERKCRILFGGSLALLIAGAFWYAQRITHQLIVETTLEKAKLYAEMSLKSGHGLTLEASDEFMETLNSMYQALGDGEQSLEVSILKADELPTLKSSRNEFRSWDGDANVRVANKDEEKKYMLLLQEEYRAHLAQLATKEPVVQLENPSPSPVAEADLADTETVSGATQGNADEGPIAASQPTKIEPKSHLVHRNDLNRYHYYQPVYWTENCSDCHRKHVFADGSEEWPFRVIKVAIGDDEATGAKNRVAATLATTTLITVFLAMISLYVVVRYVIVKPLQHLRDVSEEVRRGNLNLRAALQTDDEFEELGDSFNRMLRHLVDAQMELRKTNSQLDLKVDELAQANMQLFEMNRLKSDFLASMSHELRTPLNSIIGFSDVLQGGKSLDERQKRYASNIGRAGRSLLEMINEILDLAKMESGQMQCRPVEFSVDTVVHENCDMVRPLSEEKNIDLEVDIEPDLPVVYQDRGKVQQILTNLVSNAIKFTPEGGRITVSARRTPEKQLVLVVADTGIGISEEDRALVFEKFRQGSAVLGTDHLTREYSGTGLGLSIVKELCRLLDGEITFESEVGKGSVFTVQLPWIWSKPVSHEPGLSNRLESLIRAGRSDMARVPPDRLRPEDPSGGDSISDDTAAVDTTPDDATQNDADRHATNDVRHSG